MLIADYHLDDDQNGVDAVARINARRGSAVPASSGQMVLVQMALPKPCEVEAQNGFAPVPGLLCRPRKSWARITIWW